MKILKLYLCIIILSSAFGCGDSCDKGFEGVDCQTETREKFIGQWLSDDYNCALGNPFDFEIKKGNDIDEILIDFNLAEFSATVSENQFNFDSDTLVISGVLSSNILIFNLDRPLNPSSCAGSFTK